MAGDTLFDADSCRGRIRLRTVWKKAAGIPPRETREVRLVGGRVYVHAPGIIPKGKFLSLNLDGLSLDRCLLEADTAFIPGAVDSTHPCTTRSYQVWLDSAHLLRRMKYSTTDKEVDVTYSHWGERVDVLPPTPAHIFRISGSSRTTT